MSHVSFRIDLTQLNKYSLFTQTGGPYRRKLYREIYIGFSPFWIGIKNGFGLETFGLRLLK